MYVQTRSVDLAEMLPIFFGVLIGLAIIVWIFYAIVKKQDDNKELITRRGKIIEKPVQQGNVEWYVVECENGERMKLRSFQGNKLIISVGDTGIIKYKGKTVQSFQRQ